MSLRQTQMLYQHQAEATRQYTALIMPLIREIQAILGDLADPDGSLPITRLQDAQRRILPLFNTLFLFSGSAFVGGTPVSPFARMLYPLMKEVQTPVLTAHRDFMRQHLTDETTAWLVNAQPPADWQIEPLTAWENAKGHDLNTRIVALVVTMLDKLNRYLSYNALQSTPVVRMQGEIENLMLPRRQAKQGTLPNGVSLSFEAARLVRNEITRSYTEAVMLLALLNPLSVGVEWALSPRHPRQDVCDSLATIGMSGQRLRPPYPVESAPRVIADSHVNCICANFNSNIVADGEVERFERLREENAPAPFTPLSTYFVFP